MIASATVRVANHAPPHADVALRPSRGAKDACRSDSYSKYTPVRVFSGDRSEWHLLARVHSGLFTASSNRERPRRAQCRYGRADGRRSSATWETGIPSSAFIEERYEYDNGSGRQRGLRLSCEQLCDTMECKAGCAEVLWTMQRVAAKACTTHGRGDLGLRPRLDQCPPFICLSLWTGVRLI